MEIVEVKFILIMFIWFPSPVAKSLPVWTSNVYETVGECEAAASEMMTKIKSENGRDVRVEHQCVAQEDYIRPDDELLK